MSTKKTLEILEELKEAVELSKSSESANEVNALRKKIPQLYGKVEKTYKEITGDLKVKVPGMGGMTHVFSNFFEAGYLSGRTFHIHQADQELLKVIGRAENELGDTQSELNKEELSASDKVVLIIKRFHQVARQLRGRHSDRPTLEIEDEYDVQDLFHSLLRLYFDDIRPEEYTPSYAGSASRVDFLLKQEQIIIEIKKTRKGLEAKKIGEELIIDSERYQSHPDCKRLICFVYDPEGRVANPRGIENDLTKEINDVPVSVYIAPEH